MVQSKRITIRQVAEQAGVSAQTVSRVINDRPDVAADTRQRVLEVVERLGYQPNFIARSLIHGQSATLGVVGMGIEYFGPSRTLVGIESQSAELGYGLLLSLIPHPQTDDGYPFLRDMLAYNVAGIVWAVPGIGSNHDWVPTVVPTLPVPIVFLSTRPAAGLTVVAVDNRSGGHMATRHLLEQGYRRIGLIAGPLLWWEARERQLGWRDALADAGMETYSNLVVEGDWTAAGGEKALYALLEQEPDVDAVFACNDQMALGALQAARNLGRRVPDDLAIVGFDDRPEAAFFWPPLTTVRQDLVDLGRRAVSELHRMILSTREGGSAPTSSALLLQPQLVVRASSIAPPGRRNPDDLFPAPPPSLRPDPLRQGGDRRS